MTKHQLFSCNLFLAVEMESDKINIKQEPELIINLDSSYVNDTTIELENIDESITTQHQDLDVKFKVEEESNIIIETRQYESIDKLTNKYKCKICKKSFKFKGLLTTHVQVKHLSNYTKFEIKYIDQNSTSDIYVKDETLNQRLLTNNEINDPKCNVCDKTFENLKKLENHMIRVHKDAKKYKCTECDKEFRYPSSLTVHRRLHTGDKPYECKFCEKAFTNQGDFKRHILVHTGDKNYTCEICDKSFKRMEHLKTHIRTHSGDKPFKCTECDKTFGQLAHLRSHHIVHNKIRKKHSYKCDQCSKVYSHSNSLKKHILIFHNSVEQIPCHICGKPFKCLLYLKDHIRRHSKNK